MKTREILAIVGIGLCTIGSGCSEQPTDIPKDMEAEQFKAQAEAIVNRFAAGLHAKDAKVVESVLSTEVRDRLKTFEGGIGAFMEKQRTAMLSTHTSMASGTGEGFKVTTVAKQEGFATVTFSRDGATIPRPIYFVLEGDAYRLNVARPGFSKQLPAGAAGDDFDTYIVKNRSRIPVQTGCDGANFFLQPYEEKAGRCRNTCGFWFSGSYFGGSPWWGTNHCDYNWTGHDVEYVNSFRCVSGC